MSHKYKIVFNHQIIVNGFPISDAETDNWGYDAGNQFITFIVGSLRHYVPIINIKNIFQFDAKEPRTFEHVDFPKDSKIKAQ